MVGYHDALDKVICRDYYYIHDWFRDGWPPQSATQNGAPNQMHICPPGAALQGVNEQLNAFWCVR
jgi:hypothetical protein